MNHETEHCLPGANTKWPRSGASREDRLIATVALVLLVDRSITGGERKVLGSTPW